MFQRLWVSAFLVLGISGLCCAGDAGGPADGLDAACQKLADCPRADDVPRADRERQCRDNFNARYDAAAEYGCSSAYADLVSCYATSPDVCGANGVVAGCESVQEAFRACQGRAGKDECVLIANVGGTSGCQIGCALFQASCETPDAAGQHACTCNQGEKAGASFSVAACDERVEAAARAACQ